MNGSQEAPGTLLFPILVGAIAIGVLVHRIWMHSRRPKPQSEREVRLFRGESLELRGAAVIMLAALLWAAGAIVLSSWLSFVAFGVGGLGLAMVGVGSYRRKKSELGG